MQATNFTRKMIPVGANEQLCLIFLTKVMLQMQLRLLCTVCCALATSALEMLLSKAIVNRIGEAPSISHCYSRYAWK